MDRIIRIKWRSANGVVGAGKWYPEKDRELLRKYIEDCESRLPGWIYCIEEKKGVIDGSENAGESEQRSGEAEETAARGEG